jgi:hypothetical protein
MAMTKSYSQDAKESSAIDFVAGYLKSGRPEVLVASGASKPAV